MLLAGRILRSVLNQNTSSLKVTADIVPNGSRGDSSKISSRGAEEGGIVPQNIKTTLQKLKAGTEIKIHVTNNEKRSLYIAVLVIGSNGEIVLLHPSEYDSAETASLIAPGKEVVVPPTTANPENDFNFIVQGPSGFLELLVIASAKPLRNALRGLKQIAEDTGTRSGEPLELKGDETVRGRGDVKGVDNTQLAALSATIEVSE